MTSTDATMASSARIYDHWLGGTDNYAVDREVAATFEAKMPDIPASARASRGFLLRAVRFMAEQGIRQFLDIGAGIPLAPNVHDIAREAHPEARVVCVDNDPIVLAKGDALRNEPGVITVEGDLRDPAAILAHPDVAGLLDFSKPVGVLTVAIWHFMPGDTLARFQAPLRESLASGSYLALTHACTQYLTAAQIEAGEALYAQTTNPVKARTREEVMTLFDGFEIVEPGLVPLHEWRPRAGDPFPEQSTVALAGVGILR